MTEVEWLACDDPATMLRCPGVTASDRKLRLFCLACCQRIVAQLTDPRSQAAVDFLDRYADVPHSRRKGVAGVRKAAKQAHSEAYMRMMQAQDPVQKAKRLALSNAANAAYDLLSGDGKWAAEYTAAFSVHAVAWKWLVENRPELLPEYDPSAGSPERRHQTALFRDIVGNPFRPVALDPVWQTTAVVGLADAVYADRAFDRLPILAEALEEAGCTNVDLLSHCRGPGPHVRGCWAVDLILAKS